MIAEPREKQVVTFLLRNVSKERVGVVLKVNNKNTLYEEEEEPAQCTKWILDPGEQLEVKGFSSATTRREFPFKVLSTADSEVAAVLGTPGHYPARLQVRRRADENQSQGEPARPVFQPERENGPPGHAQGLAEADRECNQGSQQPRRLEKDTSAAGTVTDFKEVDFPNPTQVENVKIRYYKRNGTGGGTPKP